MTIHYKSLNLALLSHRPLIMISDIEKTSENTLVIKISDIECAYVFVDGKRHRIVNGRAEIPLNETSFGINTVTFVSETKKFQASPFFKSENGIERVPLDSTSVKALESLLISICQKLEYAEKRISVLEEKTIPRSILTFD